MKRHILILFALTLSLSAFSQADTAINRMVSQKLDSFRMTLDSLEVIDRTASGTAITTIDTLRLPVNTAGIFTVDYINEDAARHSLGHGQKLAFIANWNGVYTIPDVSDSQPYTFSGGLPQGPVTIKVVGGVPLLQVGNPMAVLVKWRFLIDRKVKPL